MTAQAIIQGARAAGRALLNEVESKQLLEGAGIPTTSARLATSREEAMRIAAELGFPVVLKVLSEDIPHKSDVGGVQLGLADAEAVGAAWDRIMEGVRAAVPNARVDGVSVQRQAPPGTEVIVGMTKDAQFGPVLMFGLGGILVDVKGAGQPIGWADPLIAAIALRDELVLVTGDSTYYQRVQALGYGLHLSDWHNRQAERSMSLTTVVQRMAEGPSRIHKTTARCCVPAAARESVA